MIDLDAIEAAVAAVTEPGLRRTLSELGMVDRVEIVDGGEARVVLSVPSPAWPVELLGRAVAAAAKGVEGVEAVAVDVSVMDEDRQEALAEEITAGRPERPGDRGSKTRVIAVSSGKGGVGKSSVTANTAVALGRLGYDVAVVDADVWGFSIPGMLGIEQPPVAVGRLIVPPSAGGVRAISMDFFVPADRAVVWRGPMLHKALEQFLGDVFWDEPDFLFVDMPPGTGDVAISLSQFLPRSQTIVVTTPQPTAQRVAKRAALMAEQVNQEVLGVVENMSWFTGDDGKRYSIFGEGGGEQLAADLGVPLLGRVPLLAALREGADQGLPVAVAAPESEAAAAFEEIARRIIDLRPRVRTHPELVIS